MNLVAFFDHWGIRENPFRGEEARQDPVFRRLEEMLAERTRKRAEDPGAQLPPIPAVHSDFEKIVGDLSRPTTSIVFGEKGSGKTAIRLQLAERVEEHNARHPERKCALLPYDDLNPVLDRFYSRISDGKNLETEEAFGKLTLNDHMDGLLSLTVPRIVDTLLKEHRDPEEFSLGESPRRAARSMDLGTKTDLILLQAVYDRESEAPRRTRSLKGLLGLGRLDRSRPWWWLLRFFWLAPVSWLAGMIAIGRAAEQWALYTFVLLAVLYGLVVAKALLWDTWVSGRVGKRLRRHVRVMTRSAESWGDSVHALPHELRREGSLPVSGSDDTRYEMLARLRRVLSPFGYHGVIVVVDRVDEPTLVAGDAERMRSVIWPMLNNKFLQQDGFGVKLLLPMELRHAVFRESTRFFQEARLDKQNLIERLSWTGATLYDLCNARLRACLTDESSDLSLLELFAEDVSRQDLVDALDQMHQPRDAFKLLYRCLSEHCSNVTHEEQQWRIPRLTLESVRKDESERVRQLYRGVRPN